MLFLLGRIYFLKIIKTRKETCMFDSVLGSMLTMTGTVAGTNANSSKWAVGTFLNNLNKSIFKWGQTLVVIIGIVMVIVGVFNIAKGLMSGGKTQVNWVINILLFFIGGALAFSGGWNLVQDISAGGYSTLQELGNEGGSLLVYFSTLL